MKKPVSKARQQDFYQQAEREWKRGRLAVAFRLFLDAAKGGDKEAYRMVAQFYDSGDGTPRDEGRALYWYRRAHRACSDRAAANNIGCIVRDRGEIQRALWWFRRAVSLGDAEAHLNIAKIYLQRHDQFNAKRHLNMLLASEEITEGSREEAKSLLR